MSLLKDTMYIKAGQFVFNSLSITNLGTTDQTLGLRIELPKGWSLMNNIPTDVTLSPGNTSNVTFRIRANGKVFSNIRYTIRVIVDDPTTGKSSSKYIFAYVSEYSNWQAAVIGGTSYATEFENLPSFKLKISNFGNRNEGFEIKFDSKIRLSVPSEGLQVILKPGTDTLITIGVRSRYLNQISDRIKIDINSRSEQKTIFHNVHFLSEVYEARPEKFNIAPISLRLNSSNLFNLNQSFYYLDADSYISFENDFAVSFRFRTNGNSANNNIFGNYQQYGFHFKKLSLQVGTQQDFTYNQIYGNGIRLNYRTKRSFQELLLSKGIAADVNSIGLKQEFNLGKGQDLITETQINNNKTTKVDNFFSLIHFNNQQYEKLKYGIKVGITQENQNNINKNIGPTGGYNLTYNLPRLNLESSLNYYSRYFPGVFRGQLFQSHQLLFKNKKMGFGANYTQINKNPAIFDANFNELKDYLNINLEEKSVFIRRGSPFSMITLKYSEGTQRQIFVNKNEMIGNKIVTNYFFKKNEFVHNLQLSLNNNTYGTSDTTLNNIKSLSAIYRGNWKRLQVNARYERGPTYIFDFQYLKQTGNAVERQQLNVNYHFAKKSNFKWYSGLNYFNFSTKFKPNINLQTNLYFETPKMGLSYNCSFSQNIINLKSQPYLSISIQKDLNIPIPFYKKYKSVNLKLYKDNNNNRQWDNGEEPVQSAKIKINDFYMASSDKGNLILKNVDKGQYIVNYGHIENQQGWMPAKGLKDTLRVQQDKDFLVPFIKTSSVSGILEFEAAKNSLLAPPDLSGVIVEAKDSKGNTYRTITSKNGNFYINLPNEQYTINLQAGVFGDQYFLAKNNLSVVIRDNQQVELAFLLKEKSRKINIKKLD